MVLIGLLALQSSPDLAVRLRRAALTAVPSVVALGVFLAWMAVERGSALLPFGRRGRGIAVSSASGW